MSEETKTKWYEIDWEAYKLTDNYHKQGFMDAILILLKLLDIAIDEEKYNALTNKEKQYFKERENDS